LEPAADVAAMHLGADDPDVLQTMWRLATVHRELGELAAARRVLEEALDGGLDQLGDADPLILTISAELGAIADELGNKHEARRNLGRVASFGADVLGAEHPYVRAARRYLGEDAPAPQPPPAETPTVAANPTITEPPVQPNKPLLVPEEPGVYRPARPLPRQATSDAPPTPQDHNPGVSAETPALTPLWTPDDWPDDDAPRRSRTRGVLIGLVILLILAGGVIGVLVLHRHGGTPAAIPSVPASTSSSSTGRAAAQRIQLRDQAGSVTLTWTDPTGGTVPFIVAGGRAGEKSRAFQSLPPGQTAYTVNGLNPGVDYCFAVVAVYSTNDVAASDLVCTHRINAPSPSR
jgi:hypothetical protein